ncbi:MAG: hypothetical protein AABX33_02715 [Nanoarchaeota archaeon]
MLRIKQIVFLFILFFLLPTAYASIDLKTRTIKTLNLNEPVDVDNINFNSEEIVDFNAGEYATLLYDVSNTASEEAQARLEVFVEFPNGITICNNHNLCNITQGLLDSWPRESDRVKIPSNPRGWKGPLFVYQIKDTDPVGEYTINTTFRS